MNILEEYSQRLVQNLEQRKAPLPYSFVWCLLGLGSAIILFGFLDRVWPYYLEGMVAVGAGVLLFLMETCLRRITELKMWLSEYRMADRSAEQKYALAADPVSTEEELPELPDMSETAELWSLADRSRE